MFVTFPRLCQNLRLCTIFRQIWTILGSDTEVYPFSKCWCPLLWIFVIRRFDHLTATILKIVLCPYLSRESSEYDEIWCADAHFDQGDGNVSIEIPKFKMADGRRIENHFFCHNSAPYCPIKTKFGMRRYNRMHTKVRWWQCQISKIQHDGGRHFKNCYTCISIS